MGIGGLGPQDGVKIIEHDNINYQFSNNGLWFMCLLQTTRSFFLKNQFLVLATTSVQHGAGEEAHIQVLNEAGFFG